MPLTSDVQGQNQLLHFSAFLWAHLPGISAYVGSVTFCVSRDLGFPF